MLYLVSEAEWIGLDWTGVGYAQMHSTKRTLKRETTQKKEITQTVMNKRKKKKEKKTTEYKLVTT